MSNNFCANCREPLDNDAKFCVRCGTQAVQQAPPIGPGQPQYYPPQQYRPPIQYQAPQPQPYPPHMQQTAQTVAYAPGRKLLNVVGILYIVIGSLGILFGIISVSMLVIMDDWLLLFGGEAMRGAWHFFYIAPIFVAIFAIFVGIMAVANCKNIKMASSLLTLGIIDLVIEVLYPIINVSMGVYTYMLFGALSLFFLPIGLALPVLYIIGARKNMLQQAPANIA